MNRFQIYKTKTSGDSTGALRPADEVYHRLLEPDTQVDVTVPDGADVAIFSGDIDFWVGYDAGTVAVPTADTDVGTVEYLPDTRFIGEVTTVNLISESDGFVSIVFYRGH